VKDEEMWNIMRKACCSCEYDDSYANRNNIEYMCLQTGDKCTYKNCPLVKVEEVSK